MMIITSELIMLRTSSNVLWRCCRRNNVAASRVVIYLNGQQTTFVRCITTQEEIYKYKNETAALARWLDVSIVQRKGRAFDANTSLIDASDADTFPNLRAHCLNGSDITIPTDIQGKAKLVVFSFKHYGFSLLRSWIDPFVARYHNHDSSAEGIHNDHEIGAVAFEICFIEYGFLSIAKSVFVKNIKLSIDPSRIDHTAIVFGGVKDFAAPLLLPNVYTGYAYLLDRDNKIRWKGSGLALDHEVQRLMDCTDELLKAP